MSRRTCIVVLLGVLLSSASATITFERTWYPGYLQVVEQTPDDGYILAFQSHDSALEQVGGLVKTDSPGNLEWCRLYHSPPNYHGGTFDGLCSTLDGGYIGAGSIGVSYAWAVKTDSVGESLWAYVHSGPAFTWFLSAVATPDSGCVLAGRLSEGSDMGLLKLSRNGEREWLRAYCPPHRWTSYGYVARRADGRGFYVNGTISGDSFNAIDDDYIVRTDSVGETLWTVRYRPNLPGYMGTWNGAGCVTADGGYAICGMAALPDRHPSYVAKFDSAGVNLWTRVFFDSIGSPDHFLKCIKATPDGGSIVVGSQLRGSTKGILLMRLDSLGDTLWTKLFKGLDPQLEDWGYWVINTHDGGFAACGTADQDQYAYLIKTDSLGMVYNAVSEQRPSLLQNPMLAAEPNPFRRLVSIRCGAALSGTPSLNVYDALGRIIRRLAAGRSATWDGRSGSGQLVPAGTYFIEARTGPQRWVVQVLFAR